MYLSSSPMLSKVLIVDDNPIDLFIAESMIRKTGFAPEVVTKDSACGALAYLQAHADKKDQLPQLILLDVQMPCMDGFGFLNQFNLLSEIIRKSCSVMMLSSSLNPEDHQRAFRNPHVLGFLNKPLDAEKLKYIAFLFSKSCAA